MSAPEPIDGVDLSQGDPELAAAPLVVRKADAWLQAFRQDKLARAALMTVIGLPMLGFFGAFLLAGIGGSEGAGALALFSSWVATVPLWIAYHRRWGSTQSWAHSVVTRYKQLQELGVTDDFAPQAATRAESAAIRRLVGRIEALGRDRPELVTAAAHAGDRAVRLEKELAHLDDIGTGDPLADQALDAARDRIQAELARVRALVAEVYATLVALDTDEAHTTDLTRELARLGAELEVEEKRALQGRALAAARKL